MQQYQETAIEIEFRIPDFYWGNGLIIINGTEFYGLIANDLILGTINDNNSMDFSVYFRFPYSECTYGEYVERYQFHYPRCFMLNTTFNIQGIDDDNNFLLTMLTMKDICTTPEKIEIEKDSIQRIRQELGV